MKGTFFFILGGGLTPCDAQGLVIPDSTQESLLVVFGGLYGIPVIKPCLGTCTASIISSDP